LFEPGFPHFDAGFAGDVDPVFEIGAVGVVVAKGAGPVGDKLAVDGELDVFVF